MFHVIWLLREGLPPKGEETFSTYYTRDDYPDYLNFQISFTKSGGIKIQETKEYPNIKGFNN